MRLNIIMCYFYINIYDVRIANYIYYIINECLKTISFPSIVITRPVIFYSWSAIIKIMNVWLKMMPVSPHQGSECCITWHRCSSSSNSLSLTCVPSSLESLPMPLLSLSTHSSLLSSSNSDGNFSSKSKGRNFEGVRLAVGGFGRESGNDGGDEAFATYVFFFVCSLSYALFVMLMVEIHPLFYHHWNHSQLVYSLQHVFFYITLPGLRLHSGTKVWDGAFPSILYGG